MEEQAGQLSDAVSIFRLDEYETTASAPAVAPAPRAPARPASPAPAARKPASRAVAAELAEGDWQEF
jgi:methyl-accepting chemotaxis protein